MDGGESGFGYEVFMSMLAPKLVSGFVDVNPDLYVKNIGLDLSFE